MQQTHIMFGGALLLGVGAAAMLIAQALSDATILPLPDTSMSPGALLALVMLVGAIGGLLSTLAVYLGARFGDKNLPIGDSYDMRLPRAVLKITAGVWTGASGVWLVSSGIVDAAYTSVGVALLLALVFGFAQEAVTRFYDRYVTRLLEAAAPKA